MWKNYFKIAWRNLLKQKVYSAINVLGLTLGFLCCILIFLHVKDELSYDDFLPDHDRIYRIALERVYPDHVSFYAVIPDSYSEVIAEEVKGVEHSTRLFGMGNGNVVEIGDQKIEEEYMAAADSNFYKVFDFKILNGEDKKSALKRPNTVVLTARTSKRLFNDADPIGKTIRLFNEDYEVSAVMEDVPDNSHFRFDYLFSSISFPGLARENFTGFSAYTYLKLSPETSPESVESALPDLVEKYAAGQIERELGVSFTAYSAAGNGYNYFLQPLGDIHLHSNLEGELKPNGNYLYVYIFTCIAIFILVLACINFVNLATARSAERAREVGVRKAMGSDRRQIITQFLLESMVLTFISLVLGLLLSSFALPYFNNLAEKALEIDLEALAASVPLMIVFGLLVGFLAGYYPAFHLSKLSTVAVLKGKLQTQRGGDWLRNGMVVFQFAVAILLIAVTLTIHKQIEFIQSISLGFQKENVLVLNRYGSQENKEVLRNEIEKIPEVIAVGTSNSMPGKGTRGVQFTKPGGGKVLTTKSMSGDDHFFQTLGIQPINGRVFDEQFNDSLSLVLNQEAAKVFFGNEDPIGQKLLTRDNSHGKDEFTELTVIGVVDNFNFESLHARVTPLAVFHVTGPVGFENFLSIRYAGGAQEKLVRHVEEKWNQLADGSPFSFFFLDNDLAQLYKKEQVSSQILMVFSILAIAIACIGLFGLAAYIAFMRTKEIGVRKVLGASVANIVFLLSLNFAKLVGLAFLIATPVAWYAMDSWLGSFAFQTDLNPMIFLFAGCLTLSIALLTVSFHSVSAALMNPVKSLKSE